jgi:tetratricopeptide (TPR) repeat protein
MPGRIEKTVFISYRRKNLPWALAIFQNLKSEGYDVFFDYLSIPSGDFESIIVENIKARAHFVVILTPSALERCYEPGDWLRREIETAMDEKRNIVPLMLESFDFGSPSTIKALTGKLEKLKKYNGLRLHSEYFFEGMERLRKQYLSVSSDTVIHPISEEAKPVVDKHQIAASEAASVEKIELNAQEWFERGYIFLEAENFDEAFRCNSEAIGRQPDFAEAYNNRSQSRKGNGDINGAISDCNEAIRLNPNLAEAYTNRGFLYVAKDKLEEGIADFEEAIRLKPELAEPYAGRAMIHGTKDNFGKAFSDFDKAISLKPSLADIYLARGSVYEIMGDFENAFKDFDEAIRLKPNFALAYSQRGDARSDKGDLIHAISDYDEAVRLKPNLADAYGGRGTARKYLGRLEEAIEDYTKAIQLDPEYFPAFNNLADTFLEQGNLEKAREYYYKRIAIAKNTAINAEVSLGIILRYNDDPASAQHFQRALSIWDEAFNAEVQSPSSLLENKALALLCLNKKTEALSALQEALSRPRLGDPIEFYRYKLLESAPNPPDGIEEVISALKSIQE